MFLLLSYYSVKSTVLSYKSMQEHVTICTSHLWYVCGHLAGTSTSGQGVCPRACLQCYAWTLHGAMKCPKRRELGALLFYEQWVSI
jgi:hypothetical protein